MQSPIIGLMFERDLERPSRRIESAPQLRRLAFRRPVNLVFHGHGKRFSYEYYGIHRGTEDRLTFLGPPNQIIFGYFIDCRENSPTWGCLWDATFQPSIDQTLVIPPGVAHTFDGLEDVYTINTFRNFLPDPARWISGDVEWAISADTINLPRKVSGSEIPVLEANPHEASDMFYALTTKNLLLQDSKEIKEYPLTREFTLPDGSRTTLRFERATPEVARVPEMEVLAAFPEAYFARRSFVTGNEDFDSGYTTFLDPRCVRLIGYSESPQSLRIPSTKRRSRRAITVFGPPHLFVRLTLARRGLKTVRTDVPTSPFRELVIPGNCAVDLEVPSGVVVAVQDQTSDASQETPAK